jgi:hypothetical protein
MATYDNSYAMKITPNTPNLRGLTTNYSNNGQTNLGGIGLGDLFELDYDRDKIENIFNQGTDAQYALMQKENQIAQNQYANNQFQQQQMALDTLRAQRNSQIASGMARGLNAAADQAQVLGLQQEGMSGALELANEQQTMADTIAAEYANNVVEALKEANSVKQAMAEVSAMLYDADMLGYTGELSAAAQMDKNASDRYGYDVGLEGTKYQADKEYAAALAQAAATRAAASIAASSGSGSTEEVKSLLDEGIAKAVDAGKTGNDLVNYVRNYVVSQNSEYASRDATGALWDQIDEYVVNQGLKDQTKKNWEKSQTKNSMTTNAGGNAAGGGGAGGRTIKTVPAYLKNHPDLQLSYGYTKANGYVDATY